MLRYLAGRNRNGTVEVSGFVDAPDIVAELRKAQDKWGDLVGVMPPCAVARWMKRGAALNEARQLVAVETP